tara:strand:- start:862 stop:1254 length:393 start_codon:yes stop_codon:yes gene_type:complete
MIAEELENLGEATFTASDGYEEEYDGPGEGDNQYRMKHLNSLFTTLTHAIRDWKMKTMQDDAFVPMRSDVEAYVGELHDAIAEFRNEKVGGFLGFGGQERASKYSFKEGKEKKPARTRTRATRSQKKRRR